MREGGIVTLSKTTLLFLGLKIVRSSTVLKYRHSFAVEKAGVKPFS